MSEDVTLHDLPMAFRQGQPGWRRLYDPRNGSVYVAVPYMNWKQYASPRVQARWEWEQIRKAAGRQYNSTVRNYLCQCARCQFLIGRGFEHQEVYLEPVLRSAPEQRFTLDWRLICSTNALEHGLTRGYCVVSESDWVMFDGSMQNVHSAFVVAVKAKIQRISPAFLKGWEVFKQEQQARYRELRRRWAREDHRALWSEIFPTWRAYLQAYYRLHIRNWWERYDDRGYGCPEHHAHPRDCATGFHARLFRLEMRSSFETFRASYEPEVWTLQHHLHAEGMAA